MRGIYWMAIVLATVFAGGCSSKTAEPQTSVGARVIDVGSIVVRYASSVATDDRKLLDEVNGGPRLKTAVEGELGKAAKLRSGSPRVLEIEVTEFRLRSGATVFLAGIMAGVDTLQVKVRVREGAQVVREFTTGDSTSGGFGGLSSSSRYQTMADAVAERLRTEL
jgi:hypothetical protein